jgi:hypothetical protein
MMCSGIRAALVLPLFDEHRSRDDAGQQRIDAQDKESGVIEVTHATSALRFDDVPAYWKDEITVAVIARLTAKDPKTSPFSARVGPDLQGARSRS